MKFFKQKNNSFSDYKNLLEIYAEMEFQSFSELSKCQQKELVAAWIEEDSNEDEVINMLLSFKQTGLLSECLYDGITSKNLGELLTEYMITEDHIKSINIDMDEAFGDYLMSLDGYQSDEEALILVDNIDRVKCARMGVGS